MGNYARDTFSHQSVKSNLSMLNPVNWFKSILGMFGGLFTSSKDKQTKQYTQTGVPWEAADPTFWARSMMRGNKPGFKKQEVQVTSLQGQAYVLEPGILILAQIISFVMAILGFYAIFLAIKCSGKVWSMQLLYALVLGPLYIPFRLGIPCGTGGPWYFGGMA